MRRLVWLTSVPKRPVLGLLCLWVGLLGPGWRAPAQATLNQYCQLSQAEIDRKESLRQAVLLGESEAAGQYERLLKQHANNLRDCRRQEWPDNQATWLRLYPCDLQPGMLDALMDRIVNLGYNEVYIEAFYNGQVLLPQAENNTAWPSVIQTRGYENRDLLAEAIAAARQRGLKVSAWVFTLNFGYSYGQRADRQQALARNGSGVDTQTFALNGQSNSPEEIFIDPYNPQGQRDYLQMLQGILRRQPDAVLFDYIRYPRGVGAASVASTVGDLWIYGTAAQQALLQRALNNQGRELIRRFVYQGYITASDVEQVDALFPNEGAPLWQSRRVPEPTDEPVSAGIRRPILQEELWRLSVAHAIQGVVDFLQMVTRTAQQQEIGAGAVFFPSGNQAVGTQGYDSRLQHWDRFPQNITWHPMAYSICGNASCIVQDIQAVIEKSNNISNVRPALAGIWGSATDNRPSLEAQMTAIERAAPGLTSISHFAYSWQDPEFDRIRKFCQL
ncbi:MAG: family 10 glycosylhydrolase [Cyanobacteria bacterium J06632_22]